MTAASSCALPVEHGLFLDVVSELADRVISPAAIDAQAQIDAPALAALADAGLLGLLAEADELSPDLTLLSALTVHRLAQASAAVAVAVSAAHLAGMAVQLARADGGPADRGAGAVGPVAFADGRESVAVTANGPGFMLSGSVDPVAGALGARCLLVLARHEGTGVLATVVPDQAGVVIDAGAERSGLRAARGRLNLRDCVIGEANRVGGPRGPAAVAAHADLLLAATAAGVAASAVDNAAQYMAQRRQFGQAIADFAGLRSVLGRLAADADAAWGLVESAARSAEPWSASARVLAARAVAVATRVAVRNALDGLQMFGGYGYTAEYPAERLVRDAISLRARAAGGVRGRLAMSADGVLGPVSGE